MVLLQSEREPGYVSQGKPFLEKYWRKKTLWAYRNMPEKTTGRRLLVIEKIIFIPRSWMQHTGTQRWFMSCFPTNWTQTPGRIFVQSNILTVKRKRKKAANFFLTAVSRSWWWVIYFLKIVNPVLTVFQYVWYTEHHGGSVVEGAVRVCCGSLSQLEDRPGPQGAAHQRSLIHQPDRPSCWKAGQGLADCAWLVLPMKQKLCVISLPQLPSDVRVFY